MPSGVATTMAMIVTNTLPTTMVLMSYSARRGNQPSDHSWASSTWLTKV